jgi:hypothetical protein
MEGDFWPHAHRSPELTKHIGVLRSSAQSWAGSDRSSKVGIWESHWCPYPLSSKRGAREGSSAPTPPPAFLAKSAESLENKRVEFCGSARKYKKVQKSVEECEKTEVRGWKFKD